MPRLAVGLSLLVASVMLVFGGAELVLRDGRVLEGTDVRRSGEDYVLVLEGGGVVTVPSALVESVRLGGEGERDRQSVPTRLDGGSEPTGPTGMRRGRPETLAGEPARPPSPQEQTAALGAPAEFQHGVVENRWTPSSDWNMDPAEQNNFNPSSWAKGPIDPTWEPESAWQADDNVLESSRSSWTKDVIDPHWAPSDGFATSAGRR